jgi:hypothetical protein
MTLAGGRAGRTLALFESTAACWVAPSERYLTGINKFNALSRTSMAHPVIGSYARRAKGVAAPRR